MQRRRWLKPEILIAAVGLVTIALVAIEMSLVQSAFTRASPSNFPAETVMLQLAQDRDALLRFGWVLILLILAMFVGLALMLVRNRRANEQLKRELEHSIQERTAQLAYERNLLRTLIDHVPDLIYAKDRESRIILANQAVADFMGAGTPANLLGKSDADYYPAAIAGEFRASERALMESGTPLIGESQHISEPDGRDVWLSTTKVPLRDAQGQVIGLVGASRDVTEMRAKDILLEQREQLYRSLVDAMPLCVFRKDREGRITYGNARFWSAIGYSEQEGMGKTDYDISPREIADKYRRDDLAIMQSGETTDIVEDHQPRRGERQVIRALKSPVRDAHGQVNGVQVMFWDITEGRMQGEKLRQREELLSRILDTVEDGILIVNQDDSMTFANKATERILGATHQEIVTSKFNDSRWQLTSVVGKPLADQEQPLAQVIATGEAVYDVEQSILRADGTRVTVSLNAAPLHDEGGNVIGEVVSVKDVTARKRAENTLRRQNEYLDALHETTLRLMSRLELNDLLQVIIQRAGALVGTANGYIYVHEPSAEEMEMSVGTGVFDQMVGSKARRGIGATGIVWESGQTLVIDDYQKWQGRLAKPGSLQLASVVSVPLKSRDQVIGVFGLAHTDATKKFDETAMGVLTRFGHLASIALQNARLYDAAQREIAERKRAELQLSQQKEVLQTVFDHIPVMIGMFDPFGHFTLINHEWERTLGYSLDEMNHGNVLAAMYPDVEQQRTALNFMFTPVPGWRDFKTVVRGGGTVDTSWAYTPLSNGTTIAFGQDITQRKQVDRLKNEFISTVSHELRTPLTSIRGSLGLIAGGVAGEIPRQAKNMIEIAHKNSERLVRLINDILDIEKIESGKMVFQYKPVELLPLLEQSVEANRGYGEQYEVSFVITEAPSDLKINADADSITQVLTNLLSNAAKFSPPGSQVEISAKRVGTQVRVAVRDHGNGIPDGFQDRIFQKFAQADSSDSRQKGGTGLGLSIVKAIVEKHGGATGFESITGQGATFYFQLPEYLETPLAPGMSDSSKPRILIIEDDRDVALLLSLMLAQGGFDTDIAYDVPHALAFVNSRPYAALTLDLMLQDRDGISLIRELRGQVETRDLPIVVVSAIAEQGKQQLNGDAMWVADWLEKPINQEQLIRAVEHAARRLPNGKPHILHVEDDPDVLHVVQSILQDIAKVTPAQGVAGARQLLEQEQFDLVILDPVLSDGDGIDLLPFMRRDAVQVPVVIFSTRDAAPAVLHQVNAALVKSRTSNEQLLRTITQLISTNGNDNSHAH